MTIPSALTNNLPPSANTQLNPPSTSTADSNSQLGPNSFITLLTAQLQSQDPLNPMDPTQMVNQLTQINSLQQLIQIQTLRSIDQAILSSINLQSTTKVILKEAAKHIHADAIALLALDPKTKTLTLLTDTDSGLILSSIPIFGSGRVLQDKLHY